MLKPKDRHPYPDYINKDNPDEVAKYKAVYRHLDHQAFPRPPLPKFIYDMIGADMVKKKNHWEYSAKQAVSTTMEEIVAQNIPLEKPLPEEAFAIYLKALCCGLYEAYTMGNTKSPVVVGIAACNDRGNFFIELNSEGNLSLFLADFPHLSLMLSEFQELIDNRTVENYQRIIGTMNQIAGIGFKLQCGAHFAHEHEQLIEADNPEYHRQLQAYIDKQEAQYTRQQRQRGMGS